MKRFLFLLIGMFFGTGFGFLLAMNIDAPAVGHDHSDPVVAATAPHTQTDHHAHHDLPVHTDTWDARPMLDVVVTKDPVSGWNVHIKTSDFVFAPARAGGESVPGEGHAHLHVDGQKIARVYGDWFHIPLALEQGAMLGVSLNDNAHHPLFWDGKPIEVIIPLPTP